MIPRAIIRYASMVGTSMTLAFVGCAEPPEPEEDAAHEEISEPPSESAPTGSEEMRTVYVPAYSHLPVDDDRKHLLSILLSIRNVDSSATVTLTHVDYFDTSGHRVRRYLRSPRQLRPLETAEFTVDTLDDVGGSGANFLIYWEGPSDTHSLLTESVMWGHAGAGYITFTSRGVELDRRPDPAAFMTDTPPAAAAPPEGESTTPVAP